MSSNLPVSAISLKQAIESLKTQHPEEISVIEAAVRKDTALLQPNEAFCIRDMKAGGTIKAFKYNVVLSTDNGGLVKIQHTPTISAQGYIAWLNGVGGYKYFPLTLSVNGAEVPNPYPDIDSRTGYVRRVYCRSVGYYFNAAGVLQTASRTTIFEVPLYGVIDFIGKAKEFPQAFALMPKDSGAPKEEGRWSRYDIDEGTDIWVNVAHTETIALMGSVLNRKRKPLEFAQTHAERNMLKHLSGLQKPPVIGRNTKGYLTYPETWVIPVTCWRPVGNYQIDWEGLVREMVQGQTGSTLKGLSESVENITETVSGADQVLLTSDEMDEDDRVIDIPSNEHEMETARQPNHSEIPKTSPPAELSDEDKKIMAQYAEAKRVFPREFEFACSEFQLNPSADHTVTQAIAIIGAINRMLDA